jgi:hypothetical protein
MVQNRCRCWPKLAAIETIRPPFVQPGRQFRPTLAQRAVSRWLSPGENSTKMCLTKELFDNSNEKHFRINVYSISNNRSSSIQNLAQKLSSRLPQYCVNAQGQIYNIIYCIITVETIPLWTRTMTVNKFMFIKLYMLIYYLKYRIYFQILFCNLAYLRRVRMGEIFCHEK